MDKIIRKSIEDSLDACKGLLNDIETINKISYILQHALESGKKVFLFGNGGSAADSQHIAAELVGRFKADRSPLPAVALTTDTSILTAVSNDFGFEHVFSRQIEALGKEGDIAWGFSTSGNSKNVLEAFRLAKTKGMECIAFLGCGGGIIANEITLKLVVGCDSTPKIQEAHIIAAHIVCELVEKNIFS